MKASLRSNEAANTNGLLDGPHAVGSKRAGDRVAVGSGRLLAEPLEKVGGVGCLTFGVGNGLAVLPGNELGNVVGVFVHEVEPLAQELGALAAGLGAERLEGFGGRLNGAFGVVNVGLRAGADKFTGRGILKAELAPCRGLPAEENSELCKTYR